MYKTALIIALFIVVFGIGGGSYYYFTIYGPRVYAASTLLLYAKLETVGLQPDASSLKDAADYAGALKGLGERMALLELMQRELARQAVPKRMANFHEAFADYVDFARSQHAHAAFFAAFLKTGGELRKALEQAYSPNSSERNKIRTIGDARQWWDERIPRAQELADDFFREEITDLANPSFAELRALWEEGSPAFDILLARIRSANPRLSIMQFGNILTPADMKQLEGPSKKIEEFLKKLIILLEQYNAYDVFAFRYSPDISQAESSNRALRFYQIMKELREIYAR